MAFVAVPGSGGIWEYDNAATKAGGVAGVRTNSDGTQVYVSVRKTGEDLTGFANSDRGELAKTYYDARV
jgi:hypothetical protein